MLHSFSKAVSLAFDYNANCRFTKELPTQENNILIEIHEMLKKYEIVLQMNPYQITHVLIYFYLFIYLYLYIYIYIFHFETINYVDLIFAGVVSFETWGGLFPVELMVLTTIIVVTKN